MVTALEIKEREVLAAYLVPTGVIPKRIDTSNSSVGWSDRVNEVRINDSPTPLVNDIVKKHNHYFKDVSNLKSIDVYRVIELFGVTNPCIQHAIKKLLVAGNRGTKNMDKDIQESIDTLIRYQEMEKENSTAL